MSQHLPFVLPESETALWAMRAMSFAEMTAREETGCAAMGMLLGKAA